MRNGCSKRPKKLVKQTQKVQHTCFRHPEVSRATAVEKRCWDQRDKWGISILVTHRSTVWIPKFLAWQRSSTIREEDGFPRAFDDPSTTNNTKSQEEIVWMLSKSLPELVSSWRHTWEQKDPIRPLSCEKATKSPHLFAETFERKQWKSPIKRRRKVTLTNSLLNLRKERKLLRVNFRQLERGASKMQTMANQLRLAHSWRPNHNRL